MDDLEANYLKFIRKYYREGDKHLVPSLNEEVLELESLLKVVLPSDYRDFITKYGGQLFAKMLLFKNWTKAKEEEIEELKKLNVWNSVENKKYQNLFIRKHQIDGCFFTAQEIIEEHRNRANTKLPEFLIPIGKNSSGSYVVMEKNWKWFGIWRPHPWKLTFVKKSFGELIEYLLSTPCLPKAETPFSPNLKICQKIKQCVPLPEACSHEEIVQLYEAFGKKFHRDQNLTPISEDDLLKIESRIGLRYPQTYFQFKAKFGNASFNNMLDPFELESLKKEGDDEEKVRALTRDGVWQTIDWKTLYHHNKRYGYEWIDHFELPPLKNRLEKWEFSSSFLEIGTNDRGDQFCVLASPLDQPRNFDSPVFLFDHDASELLVLENSFLELIRTYLNTWISDVETDDEPKIAPVLSQKKMLAALHFHKIGPNRLKIASLFSEIYNISRVEANQLMKMKENSVLFTIDIENTQAYQALINIHAALESAGAEVSITRFGN